MKPARERSRVEVTPEAAALAPLASPRTRPRDVRDMTRGELEQYALELRMMPRCLRLTDDRLRQNIMAFLDEMYENAA
jgi:hypothetical protein